MTKVKLVAWSPTFAQSDDTYPMPLCEQNQVADMHKSHSSYNFPQFKDFLQNPIMTERTDTLRERPP